MTATPRATPTRASLSRSTVLLLVAALTVGAAARVYTLDQRTLTHPEFWVPRIELPAWVHHPPQRMTAGDIIEQSLYPDVHPPGYHLVMLPWNTVMGTGLWVMRLSSALFGTLAIAAIFVYARRTDGPVVGLLSAWLLALHGFHVSWSQELRPWVLLTLLGLVTSTLLLRLHRRWQPGLAACYVALAAIGLWVDYYFWPVFAGQILWVFFSTLGRRRLPALLGTQVIVLGLATPVFIFLWFHVGRSSHVPGDIGAAAVQLLTFGGLVHPAEMAVHFPRLGPLMLVVLPLVGAAALVLGIRRGNGEKTDSPEAEPADTDGMMARALIGMALVSTAIVVWVFYPLVGQRKVFWAALMVPWAMLTAWAVARRVWPAWAAAAHRVVGPKSTAWLVANQPLFLGGVPFLLLSGVTLINPVLASYALLTLTPFFVVMMARGLIRVPRMRAPIIGAILVLSALSVRDWNVAPRSVRDYQTLASRLVPQLAEEDVILVQDLWYTVPINYYLPPSRFTVITPPTEDTPLPPLPDGSPRRRAWIVHFGPPDLLPDRVAGVAATLPDFEARTEVSANNATAVLYERVR